MINALRCPKCEKWKIPFMLASKTWGGRPDVLPVNFCGDCGALLVDPPKDQPFPEPRDGRPTPPRTAEKKRCRYGYKGRRL